MKGNTLDPKVIRTNNGIYDCKSPIAQKLYNNYKFYYPDK
jgi:hypothetical protein